MANKDGDTSDHVCPEKRTSFLNSSSTDSQNSISGIQTGEKNRTLPLSKKACEKNNEQEAVVNDNRTFITKHRKHKPYFGSIAETIKYLNQQSVEDELDSGGPVLNHLNSAIATENVEPQKSILRSESVENKSNLGNDSFIEADDSFHERKKRKRKRKHSKKLVYATYSRNNILIYK